MFMWWQPSEPCWAALFSMCWLWSCWLISCKNETLQISQQCIWAVVKANGQSRDVKRRSKIKLQIQHWNSIRFPTLRYSFVSSVLLNAAVFQWSLRTVDVLCFELEFSNVLIKSFVWHICHEDIFSAIPRTVWPRRYLGQDWLSWIVR